MSRRHGKETVIFINSVDLSTFITDSEIDSSADSHDVTGYGDDDKEFISGLREHTFSCEGNYDDGAADTPRVVIKPLLGGAAVTVLRQPEGTGAGLDQDSFSAIATSYAETNPVAGKITWSAEFQVSGAVDPTAQI